MYGKLFSSTFTGSMLGAGADVFAVWSYAIANVVRSQVELNPNLLACVIGASPDKIQTAIDFLCKPDPDSRTKTEDGRRLIREGQFAYRVVNHDLYRGIRDEDDRRTQNRESQQRFKAKAKVSQGKPDKPQSAHTEADTDTDTDTEAEKPLARTAPKKGTRLPESFQVTFEHLNWARVNVLPDPHQHIEEFQDYWKSQPGQRGVKLDWDATFRNWLRNAAKRSNGNGRSTKSPEELQREISRKLGEALR